MSESSEDDKKTAEESPDDSDVPDDLSPEELKQLLKQKEEVVKLGRKHWLSEFCIKCPFLVIVITWLFFIVCTLLTVSLNLTELAENSDREMLVWSDERVKTYDMIKLAEDEILEFQASKDLRERSYADKRFRTYILYNCDEDCGNLLTKTGFEKMWAAEKLFFDSEDYGKYCKSISSSNLNCDPSTFASITQKFETELKAGTLTDALVQTFVTDLATNTAIYDQYSGFLGGDFSSSNRQTRYLRS